MLVVVEPIKSMITWRLSSGRPRQFSQFRLTNENIRCSILLHFDAAGEKWQTRIASCSSLASFRSSVFHRRGAAGVAAATLSGDRQAVRRGVARTSEVRHHARIELTANALVSFVTWVSH